MPSELILNQPSYNPLTSIITFPPEVYSSVTDEFFLAREIQQSKD